ncbi:MAG: four helix bundle protein [Ignavibacteria bacterium]|nr:four helix bundle protein [Ignavibacteria bacterium]
MKENVVLDKFYNFSVWIVRLYQYLCNKKKEHNLSKQILRSGTSVGANVEEAIGGVSKKDFLNKLSIANKEVRETSFWLRILKDTGYINQVMFDSVYKDCDEVSRIIFSIIRTSRKNETT